MAKLSVIVPVYGVEKYIERCARSLFEQSLDDIEYIFVNDCTLDGSIDILRFVINDYPSRQGSIIIAEHTINKGLPIARKTGLDLASGEYIIHCDSDDFVNPDMYRIMYEKAISENADMVVCDMFEGSGDSWHVIKGKTSNISDTVSDVLLLQSGSLCNKMVRKTVAKDNSIVLPKWNMSEDLVVTLQQLLLSCSVSYIGRPLYYYERHQTSILGDRSPESMLTKVKQIVLNFELVLEAFRSHKVEDKYANEILHEKLWIKNQLLPVMPFQNCTKLWRNTYREINSRVLRSKMFSTKEKLNFVITYLGLYPLYCRLKRAI